jgi:hypothetical protein
METAYYGAALTLIRYKIDTEAVWVEEKTLKY